MLDRRRDQILYSLAPTRDAMSVLNSWSSLSVQATLGAKKSPVLMVDIESPRQHEALVFDAMQSYAFCEVGNLGYIFILIQSVVIFTVDGALHARPSKSVEIPPRTDRRHNT